MGNENEERFELPLNHLFITLTKEESAHLTGMAFASIYNPHRYGKWNPSFDRRLDGRTVFILQFDADRDFYKDLTAYNSGEMVEASKFAMVIKGLKTQIHSLRMNKGKRYVERKEKGGP